MAEEFKWITYLAVACNSIATDTSLQVLGTSDQFKENSWESGRFPELPIDLILRLDYRVQAGHLQISSKPHKPIPEVLFSLGDGLHGSFIDAEYHTAGQATHIASSLKQVPLSGIGTFLKLQFPRKGLCSAENPHGQLSLAHLQL